MATHKKNTQFNRRQALRIFEQADIFYHKIDTQAESAAKVNFNSIADAATALPITENDGLPRSIEQQLPNSHSQEKETLNVNISASGIAFICKEKLQPGDYLMVRVLLLSSMTTITTCGQVIYCKANPPFADDKFPYLVGVQFINLQQEDKQLLEQYVNKRKTRQLIFNILLACLTIATIMMPDLVLELLLDLISFLFETFIEALHLTNDIIEYSIDYALEAIMHTEVHNIEITTFYIELFVGLALLYPLSRKTFTTLKNLIYRSRLFYFRKKASLQYYWYEQSLWHKAGLITGIITLLTIYVLFFI